MLNRQEKISENTFHLIELYYTFNQPIGHASTQGTLHNLTQVIHEEFIQHKFTCPQSK
jgi:hypothetical protein